MTLVTTLLLSVGLAADAFAVSVSSGLCIQNIRLSKALKIALAFGFFQGLMTLLGWLLAIGFRVWIEHLDHWIAFGLLFLLGARMIWGSLQADDTMPTFNPLDPATLLALSIATSIDAMAAGISLAVLQDPIVSIAATIALVTFGCCLLGVYMGHHSGQAIAGKAEIGGGLILMGIGTKILAEHLSIISS
jgi:manganese efflux pump family protein